MFDTSNQNPRALRTEQTRPATVPQLRLVAEAPVRDLLPDGGSPRGEASGVLALGDRLLVIFDDSTDIGVIGAT